MTDKVCIICGKPAVETVEEGLWQEADLCQEHLDEYRGQLPRKEDE